MKEMTGATYTSSDFAKFLVAADAKIGKTCWLVASALGVFPGQAQGGIVDAPQNLHVITFDEAALRGVREFITKVCGAPDTALAFKVYNMEDDFKKSTMTRDAYDRDFYNSVVALARNLAPKCKGTPVVLVSSLTSLSEGICRSTLGPAGEKKGVGGDQAKWGDFAQQMTELRNHIQAIPAHVFWEGHVYKVPLKNGQTEHEDTLQIPGRSGVNFPANVGYVAKLRRMFNQKIPGSKAEPVYLDTRSSFSFAPGGRRFSDLAPQEADLTEVFDKLGLAVGGWKAKQVTRAPATKNAQARPQVRSQ